MGRVMAGSENWITPMMQMKEELVPYLGKPPFYFWVSAASVKFFGASNLTARLPSFLAALLIMLMVRSYIRNFLSEELTLPALLLLFSTSFFFFLSGAAVIDMVLTATIFGAFLASAFYFRSLGANSPQQLYKYSLVMTFCVALGFLTKGPLIFVLFGLPIAATFAFIWCKQRPSNQALHAARNAVLRYPWVINIVLFLVVVTPWFLLAEQRNPGFIQYFFVNENFLRFVTRNYQDRYGSGHVYPYGSVWIALAVAFVPWTLVLPIKKWIVKQSPDISRKHNCWVTYALFSGLAPAIFFTFARQFSPLYVLPSLPGICIASAWYFSESGAFNSTLKKIAIGTIAIYLAVIVSCGFWISETRSTAPILRLASMHFSGRREITIGVPFGRFGNPFSLWFYRDLIEGASNLQFTELQYGNILNSKVDGILVQKSHRRGLEAQLQRAGFDKVLQTSSRGKWILFSRD